MNTLKILAAATTIVAIAFAIVTLSPRAEVPVSEADIVDFGMFATTPSEQFARSLEHLGHEKPRVYRYGHQTLYFSARSSASPPDVLVEEYQRTFVDMGVNQKLHIAPVSIVSKEAKPMMKGEVMTFSATPQRFMMGGGTVADPGKGGRFAQAFRGYRHLEAQWDGKTTLVTASWTDDDFDILAATTPEASADIPACPGCTVFPAFSTVANDIDAKAHHIESPQDETSVRAFYARSLRSRGWSQTNPSRNAESKELLEFTRGTKRLMLATQPVANGTTVSLFESY